jgi:hypothetical protein
MVFWHWTAFHWYQSQCEVSIKLNWQLGNYTSGLIKGDNYKYDTAFLVSSLDKDFELKGNNQFSISEIVCLQLR